MDYQYAAGIPQTDLRGTEPEVAYKGSFNVRIGSDLHKRAAIYALEHQQTLNAFIAEAVDEKLAAEQA